MYQGDGDLAAIGTAEIIHAAARGERITAIFVNNGIYGMTGGQMAPTTLVGQRTTSSPLGRDVGLAGYPVPITEMLAILPGVAYAARGTLADAGSIGKVRAMIKRAMDIQVRGGGFAIVEVLANCPVGWGMTPQESIDHLQTVAKTYPVGVIVDRLKNTTTPVDVAAAPAPTLAATPPALAPAAPVSTSSAPAPDAKGA
jgi:2-oxoglutarate ferredoxin oxidoreductase subunit beta